MPIQYDRRDQIVVITLDREAKRNAIDGEMTDSVEAAFNDFEDDPTLRVAVITGGSSVFCAGTDIAAGSGTPGERGGLYGIIARKSPKPIIAAVEGMALGGGFEIVLACDLVVASSEARFGLPEVRRGLVATSGALFRAPRALPLNIAREMLLTGDPISAERAERLGVVNRITEPGGALDGAIELAERVVLNAPTSIRAAIQALETITAHEDPRGWDASGVAQDIIMNSEDRVEGIAAFFERREPEWPGR